MIASLLLGASALAFAALQSGPAPQRVPPPAPPPPPPSFYAPPPMPSGDYWDLNGYIAARGARVARLRSGAIGFEDYPAAALRRGEEGEAYIRFLVGPTGAVTRCEVMVSSGSAALDAASCALTMRRMRYYPAQDEAGRAIEEMRGTKVRWVLPTVASGPGGVPPLPPALAPFVYPSPPPPARSAEPPVYPAAPVYRPLGPLPVPRLLPPSSPTLAQHLREGRPGPAILVRGSITADDYPASAMRAGAQGIVTTHYDVRTDGLVVNCEIVQSSGNFALDSTSCTLLTRRLAFLPALSPQRTPMVEGRYQRIVWTLPDDDPAPPPAPPPPPPGKKPRT